jgi:hypothetical protein
MVQEAAAISGRFCVSSREAHLHSHRPQSALEACDEPGLDVADVRLLGEDRQLRPLGRRCARPPCRCGEAPFPEGRLQQEARAAPKG